MTASSDTMSSYALRAAGRRLKRKAPPIITQESDSAGNTTTTKTPSYVGQKFDSRGPSRRQPPIVTDDGMGTTTITGVGGGNQKRNALGPTRQSTRTPGQATAPLKRPKRRGRPPIVEQGG